MGLLEKDFALDAFPYTWLGDEGVKLEYGALKASMAFQAHGKIL